MPFTWNVRRQAPMPTSRRINSRLSWSRESSDWPFTSSEYEPSRHDNCTTVSTEVNSEACDNCFWLSLSMSLHTSLEMSPDRFCVCQSDVSCHCTTAIGLLCFTLFRIYCLFPDVAGFGTTLRWRWGMFLQVKATENSHFKLRIFSDFHMAGLHVAAGGL